MQETDTIWTEIQIDLTDKCNAACLFCARTNEPHKIQNINLSLDDIKKLVTSNSTIKSVVMCGNLGDASAHPLLFEIITYLRSQNCTIKLFTNGSAHSKEWWKKLAKIMGPENSVLFAIDGNDKETYEKYRVNCVWEKTLENAQSFIDNGGFAIWSLVLFNWNEHQFDDIKNRATNMGFKLINKIISYRNYDNNVGTHVFQNDQTTRFIPRCIERKRLFVTARGNVYLCCWMANDEDNIPTANIKNYHSFDDLLKSKEWYEYKNSITNTWKNDIPNSLCYRKCVLNKRDYKELIPLSSSYQYYTWSQESNPPSLYKQSL